MRRSIIRRLLLPILSAWLVLFLCSPFSLATAQEPSTPPPEVMTTQKAMAALLEGPWPDKKLAADYLLKNGDPSLLPQLEELRTNTNRRVRRLLKPVINLLKNKAGLASPDKETRRAAARDLGARGTPEALPVLKQALSNEKEHWVRYDLEESIHLLNLENADPQVKFTSIQKLATCAVPQPFRFCRIWQSSKPITSSSKRSGTKRKKPVA